jgi:hypothetical protein
VPVLKNRHKLQHNLFWRRFQIREGKLSKSVETSKIEATPFEYSSPRNSWIIGGTKVCRMASSTASSWNAMCWIA